MIDDIYEVKDLIQYCEAVPLLYNQTANRLNQQFGIKSAEIALICTYFINEERRRHE